jgi:hypothetical protein
VVGQRKSSTRTIQIAKPEDENGGEYVHVMNRIILTEWRIGEGMNCKFALGGWHSFCRILHMANMVYQRLFKNFVHIERLAGIRITVFVALGN